MEKKVTKTKPLDKKGENLLRNIIAYIYDTKYFMKEGDYIKSWELISFTWGLYEAGIEMKKIKED